MPAQRTPLNGDPLTLRPVGVMSTKTPVDPIAPAANDATATAAANPFSPRQEAAAAAPKETRTSAHIGRLLLAIAVAVGLAWLGVQLTGYSPASEVGYWMGVVGGSCMLFVFLYPLRKRVSALRRWGGIKPWFFAHMTCGVLGPLIIITHSGFHIGSFNAGVALFSMLLVAGSGIVGRFIYVRIHHGMSGAHWTLAELQNAVGTTSAEVHSKLAFAPRVEQQLQAFQASLLDRAGSWPQRAWAFVTLSARARTVGRACRHELAITLKARAASVGWDAAKHRRALRKTRTLVDDYLGALLRA